MKNKKTEISLLVILASVVASPTDAKVSVKNNSNRSYADAYQQINAMRYQQEYLDATNPVATTASAVANLPVMVSDEKLAEAIVNNSAEGVTIADLDACAMIYPNGVFRWEIPESGIRKNQIPQCVSVVELRDANTNAVLATTTVGAGDSIKCNIDSFPEENMNATALAQIKELPADAAPTIQDVEAVMNEEQKQNAGLKIAAGAIISGIAGNLLAPKEAGDTKMFGTGKTQLIDTAVGAAAGASIMAASTYSGKVAGDTIKSTAVNAASGMIVGNMMAGASSSNAILATTKCKVDTQEFDCIIGTCAEKSDENGSIKNGQKGKDTEYTYFLNIGSTTSACKEILKCKTMTGGEFWDCTQENVANYMNINIGGTECTSLLKKDTKRKEITPQYVRQSDVTKLKIADGDTGEYTTAFTADSAKGRRHAYAVVDLGVKLFGYKVSDWKETLSKQGNVRYFNRNSDGSVGSAITNDKCVFDPASRDADDGRFIDLSNQARTKGTMVGAAAGGAMGGFAGYQGAKSEVTDRWTAAIREYEDSLSNFICMTGNRYLAKYNDYAEIPEITITTEQK